MDHIWKSIFIGDGYFWDKKWYDNLTETHEVNPTEQKPVFIRLEFEEKISPEEVGEIQFLTNNPRTPTIVSSLKITKLGDSFVFERTDPEAPGLREPDNPRKATNVYMYKVKKAIET